MQNANMTVKEYIFKRKILKYKLCRVIDLSKKVSDLSCEVHDLLLEVVDLEQEVPDLWTLGLPTVGGRTSWNDSGSLRHTQAVAKKVL